MASLQATLEPPAQRPVCSRCGVPWDAAATGRQTCARCRRDPPVRPPDVRPVDDAATSRGVSGNPLPPQTLPNDRQQVCTPPNYLCVPSSLLINSILHSLPQSLSINGGRNCYVDGSFHSPRHGPKSVPGAVPGSFPRKGTVGVATRERSRLHVFHPVTTFYSLF
jgi:hypothetical protein